MLYPDQRMQIDVKHGLLSVIVGDAKDEKFYQYTVIDEFSRFRYVEAFRKASTYSSALFLENMLKAFPFKVQCVQTDSGFGFTKCFGSSKSDHDLTMFEKKLKSLDIQQQD